jgi:hypothetical protein
MNSFILFDRFKVNLMTAQFLHFHSVQVLACIEDVQLRHDWTPYQVLRCSNQILQTLDREKFSYKMLAKHFSFLKEIARKAKEKNDKKSKK